MSQSDELLQFPCEFPIKVFAATQSDLMAPARAIIERHVGKLEDERISSRKSKGARFVAITFTIRATSKSQLDRIYEELTAHQDVVMAL